MWVAILIAVACVLVFISTFFTAAGIDLLRVDERIGMKAYAFGVFIAFSSCAASFLAGVIS